MTIDRKTLVSFHNPHLSKVELYSPLQVGNGEFAFSVDPTGVQSLYNDYNQASVPLCTMSQWGWHTTPFNETLANDYSSVQSTLELTEYVYNGRAVHYPIEKKHGNEIVYDYLRENPHRLNLARVFFKKENNELSLSDISDIDQTLNLYDGYIESNYRLCEKRMKVMTAVDAESDTILLSIEQVDKPITNLSLCVAFPYGSSNITGADWSNPKKHKLLLVEKRTNYLLVKHILDDTEYYTEISINVGDSNVAYKKLDVAENVLIGIQGNNVSIQLPKKSDQILVKISFSQKNPVCTTKSHDSTSCGSSKFNSLFTFDTCRMWWNSFWEESGAVYLRKSTDSRAVELERRIILSLYGIAVNSCGSCPPQETGLFCNSWYGKFHLEMHLWHSLALPFWNLSRLLERSFPWYLNHLQEAQKNAAFNGYKGARWPKMVAENAIDSPSPIAPLLIWQQPHILFLLESYYQCCFSSSDNNKNGNTNNNSQRIAFLQKYWCIVCETADFMADFAVFNPQKQVYELVAPLIPVQEEYDPKTVLNPSFEVSYWKKGLEIAVVWAERLNKIEHAPKITLWNKVAENMAHPSMSDSKDTSQPIYLSHENCPETFLCYNRDHPSMLFNYSYFADKRINKTVMKTTLNRVIKCWNYESLWGWDFAAMAMTAVRLGMNETALNLLLSETPKNTYEKNGYNFQRTRTDLPSYFPGNGALLLAITLMTAGWNGNTQKLPGFPSDGTWQVEFENIVPLFE